MLGGAMAATIPGGSRPRGMTTAFVLGSVFPDADIVLFPRWFEVYYLHVHPAVTHAVTFSVVEAALFAWLLRRIVRGSTFRPIFVAGWIGILGHIASDVIDGSDVTVFAPFSRLQYGTHLFPMAEPAVMLFLATACFVAWRWPSRSRAGALAAFAMLAAFLAIKIGTQWSAAAQYRLSVPAAQPDIEIVPVRNEIFTWDVFDHVGGTVRMWRIDTLSGSHDLVLEHHNVEGALVTASRSLPLVRDLLALTRIPIVRVERQGEHDVVLWSDARMCSAERCDVSFGGVFTAEGVPQSQVIRLGDLQQLRPL